MTTSFDEFIHQVPFIIYWNINIPIFTSYCTYKILETKVVHMKLAVSSILSVKK